MDDYSDKQKALAEFLEIKSSELEESKYDDCGFEYGQQEYLVYTDDEAEAAYETALEDYVEELILPELPLAYQNYFDKERWIEDARANSWRGNELGQYDGNEEEQEYNGVTYYIYRTN